MLFGIAGMAKYWCRFFDRSDQLLEAERMLAVGDDLAIANARRAAPECTTRFEIWRNVNFIHEEIMVTSRRTTSEPRPVSSEWMIGTALSGILRLRSRA